jgi:hypothetical protein
LCQPHTFCDLKGLVAEIDNDQFYLTAIVRSSHVLPRARSVGEFALHTLGGY